MAKAFQGQEWPPHNPASWEELEYSGCFYCDRPWDHAIQTADSSILLCLDCYERRYGERAADAGAGQKLN